MHRLNRVPHSLLMTALLGLAGFFGLGVSRAAAQERVTVVPLHFGGGQTLEMSKKQRIKDIDNKDQAVARVEFVQGADFKKVMVSAGGTAGVTRVVLMDNDGNREAFDVVVGWNVEFLKRVLTQAAPTANIEIVQGTGQTVILTGTVSHANDVDVIMRSAISVVGDPARVINAMQIGGVQLVQLDVIIARVARSAGRQMGFSFLANGTQGFLTSTIAGPGGVTGAISNPFSALAGAPNLAFGIIRDNGAFLGFLQALRTENLAKVIAQPKLCTLSGQPGEFISGGEQAVPTLASGSAGGGAVSGVEFVPFGTTLRFLPLVMGGGKILLQVEPQFTFPDPNPLFSANATGTTGGTTFGRLTQRVRTSAMLEDGQTLAIGGLVFNQVNGKTSKVPVLGDLPFIGAAFSHIDYTNSEEELIILITPRLVDAMSCRDLPKFLPGEETRKVDDFELFLERILEAPRGPREVWQCDKYVPAYRNSPTAGMYPCPDCDGPRGACDLGCTLSPFCGPDRGIFGSTVVLPGVNTSAPQAPAVMVKPMAPAPMPSAPPRLQQLPEIRGQYQAPGAKMAPNLSSALLVETSDIGSAMPRPMPPGVQGVSPAALLTGDRPSGTSGVSLARPTGPDR